MRLTDIGLLVLTLIFCQGFSLNLLCRILLFGRFQALQLLGRLEVTFTLAGKRLVWASSSLSGRTLPCDTCWPYTSLGQPSSHNSCHYQQFSFSEEPGATPYWQHPEQKLVASLSSTTFTASCSSDISLFKSSILPFL